VPDVVVADGEVFDERAAEGDVEHLQPAAHAEDGEPCGDGRRCHGEVEIILRVVDVVDGCCGVAVAGGVDVAAAGQHDAVESREVGTPHHDDIERFRADECRDVVEDRVREAHPRIGALGIGETSGHGDAGESGHLFIVRHPRCLLGASRRGASPQRAPYGVGRADECKVGERLRHVPHLAPGAHVVLLREEAQVVGARADTLEQRPGVGDVPKAAYCSTSHSEHARNGFSCPSDRRPPIRCDSAGRVRLA
jgi:hypothetical protein